MEAKIFKCFISSPSDTAHERTVCDEVLASINRGMGNLGFRVESLKWEKNVFPNVGTDAQAVIRQQIGTDYDIFIGIMKHKFGTPTSRAGSGTEEEFDDAYKLRKDNSDLPIMFYFSKAPIEMDNFDSVQIQKVKEFKEKVSSLGGLYATYSDIEEFKERLYEHIAMHLTKNYSGSNVSSKQGASLASSTSPLIPESVTEWLEAQLNKALKLFSSQPIIWIEPVLSTSPGLAAGFYQEGPGQKVSIDQIIKSTESWIIKGPPQFGLTCLARHLALTFWKTNGKLWVYLDANLINQFNYERAISNYLNEIGLPNATFDGVVLDSWTSYTKTNLKLLKNLSEFLKETPLIVMHSVDDSKFGDDDENVQISRSFLTVHMLPLERTKIRSYVSKYNQLKQIGDEDSILSKLLSDLEVLNAHRTPVNCLTLLKVSEKNFDENPVNRTEMLRLVLTLLFDLNELPTYKLKPDLKDCEYVLGRFCEKILRTERHTFSRADFIREIEGFCKEKLVDLEVELVFEVLHQNNIIISKDSEFIFRFSYWIYYFAAQRMHREPLFAKYIFDEKKYVDYPEIIEFYTGIDRGRADALKVLLSEMNETCKVVQAKVGLPDDMNPLHHCKWNPSDQNIQEIHNELGDDVKNSKLPVEVKDRYADQTYNPIKPYNQSITTILREYSLIVLMQKVKAGAVALRNSDYVDPEIKRQLLNEIMKSLDELSKVLIALSPLLANHGRAAFEGASFVLAGHFGDSYEERLKNIILVNPVNVVGFFKADLFSHKMGPLLYDHFEKEKHEPTRHKLALLFIFERPREWKKYIENYIASVPKNSFYLYDLCNALRTQYAYSFASPSDINDIKYLIKMAIAKHNLGTRKPGANSVNKVSDSVLPPRETKED